jgi:hypothetical protein
MRIFTRLAAVTLLSAIPLATASPIVAASAVKKSHAAVQKPAKDKDEASDQVLKDAITQLQAIKNRVHAASKIYGGHRGKADEHIDAAIRELQAALQFDEHRERK